jgi:hypothetical protein
MGSRPHAVLGYGFAVVRATDYELSYSEAEEEWKRAVAAKYNCPHVSRYTIPKDERSPDRQMLDYWEWQDAEEEWACTHPEWGECMEEILRPSVRIIRQIVDDYGDTEVQAAIVYGPSVKSTDWDDMLKWEDNVPPLSLERFRDEVREYLRLSGLEGKVVLATDPSWCLLAYWF